MISLDFSSSFRYDDAGSGIIVPVEMMVSNRRIGLSAVLDTGASVTLNTQGLEWNAEVFFYQAADADRNFLGRHGWLERIRMGLIHYDRLLYLRTSS